MKITLSHNPLASTVELDAGELLALRLRLEIEDLEYRLSSASLRLGQDQKLFDLDKARKACDCSFMDDALEAARRAEHFAEQANFYAAELMGIHCGDCTCVACSCSKCHAEALVGADTLGKVGKHELHNIGAAFLGERPAASAQEAAERLDLPFVPTEDWHAPYAERWSAERRQAARYMREHAKLIKAQEVAQPIPSDEGEDTRG